MRFRFQLCVVLLVMAVSITAAGAYQVTQTKSFSGIPDYTSPSLTFNKANVGAGTLNWVKVILTLNCDGGQYVLDNDADSAASGSFNFGAKGYILNDGGMPMVDGSYASVVGTVYAGYSSAFSLAKNQGDGSGDYSPLGPDGMVYVGGPQTMTNQGFVNSGLISAYAPAGTFDMTVKSEQWANYSGSSGIEVAITPMTANGTLTIIYDITPVPEPSSIVALLGGIGMLGLLRRRR